MSMRAEKKFAIEIERVINYFRKEYHLSYAQVIGVIEMFKYDLNVESIEEYRKQNQEDFIEDEDDDDVDFDPFEDEDENED